jgi:hypothetical protein
VASSVEESNKLSSAQWGLCSMEVVTEVQVDFIKCSNGNVVQYFRDFYRTVRTCLENSGRHFVRFVEHVSVAVERIAVTCPQVYLPFTISPPSVQPDRIFLQLPSSLKEEARSSERLVFTTRLQGYTYNVRTQA